MEGGGSATPSRQLAIERRLFRTGPARPAELEYGGGQHSIAATFAIFLLSRADIFSVREAHASRDDGGTFP